MVDDRDTIINQRKQIGIKISLIGLLINLFLFLIKISSGFISGSIAMIADSLNNLSDFGSSIILLIGFHIAARPADKEHPFGHARFEYVASGIIAMIIMVLGFEIGKSSFLKIKNLETLRVNWPFYLILIVSISFKLYLYLYYISQSKKLKSPLLIAVAKDSLADIIATSGLLITTLIEQLTHYRLDGYAGLVISIFIMYSGLSILLQTSNRLLGERPDQTLKQTIKSFILNNDGVYGVHDLIIHDYGVHNHFASAHVEVDASQDVIKSHDLIDSMERDIALKFNINIVLHLDPIELNNPQQDYLSQLVEIFVKTIDENISLHDFRILKDNKKLNLIFDLKVPDSFKKSNQYLRDQVEEYLQKVEPKSTCYITIDRNYHVDTVGLSSTKSDQ